MNMEGKEVYRESYDYIEDLLKLSCTDNLTIDFNRLDCNTKGELKDAIYNVLRKRKLEVGKVIFKPGC